MKWQWIVYRQRRHPTIFFVRPRGENGWAGPPLVATSMVCARRLVPVGELLWKLPRREAA